MRRIVPVIGHEFFDVAPSLHERVMDLVQSLGFECFWVSAGNIRELHNAEPMLIEIPFIVVATHDQASDIRDVVDLITPLVEKFPSASIVRNMYTEIPKEIYRHTLERNTKPVSDLVQKAVREIYSKISDQRLSVTMIANNVHVSDTTLQRAFHKEFGKGVWDYIIEMRIEQANRLLAETTAPIYALASAVGYINLASFDRIYKKKMKMSPLQYRKKKLRERNS